MVKRAEGNALLAVETARALGRGGDEIAPSLRGSVRATLAPLAPQARRLVEIAAVAARPLGGAELAQLPIADPDEAATEALQSGLLVVTDGDLGFAHQLLRDAVYEEIARPRRRGLARPLGAWAAGQRTGGHARTPGGGGAPSSPGRGRRRSGPATRARGAGRPRGGGAARRRPAIWRRHSGSFRSGPICGSNWASSRRGGVAGTQAEAAFQRALAGLDAGQPLELARAWLRRARAYHGPICVPRAVLESADRALVLLRARACLAPQERSEALAASAWAQAVAGSVDEAERLLVELSAERDHDDLRTYDVAHARALALMRRGRFADAYGPSIAAGDAIERADRPDLAYGCWANAASAATAAGEPQRALEFLDRGMTAVAGRGLQSLEVHHARGTIVRAQRPRAPRGGAQPRPRQSAAWRNSWASRSCWPWPTTTSGSSPSRRASTSARAPCWPQSLVAGAPISRPVTRLALAEALARSGRPDQAAAELRAVVLEPVAPSDFPAALVPRLARVQGLIALAREEPEEARRRLQEAIAGWQRLLGPAVRAESVTTVLADLGRPVVGLVEPERELARARADLHAITSAIARQGAHAVIP